MADIIVATQIRDGMTIVYNGEPHKVVSVQHVTPGKGRGMIQTKLRNLLTGTGFDNRFRSDEKVEKAFLETHEMTYLYSDGSSHVFMNAETYEQVSLTDEAIGEAKDFLIPNISFTVEYYETTPVGVEPPQTVELKVTDTAPNMKGATQSASNKPATLENGLVVQVPAFIENGEVIRVDTKKKEYMERAK